MHDRDRHSTRKIDSVHVASYSIRRIYYGQGMTHSNAASGFSLNQLDLNLLRVFDAIMRERSITRAAMRLGRTQPSVSHALNRLRDILGDELFLRVDGQMAPTPRAKDLSVTISKALSDVNLAIEQHLHFEPKYTTRTFRLCVSDYTAVVVLQALIQKFITQAPKAKLNVVHAQNFEVALKLRKREIDCAIVGDYSGNDPLIEQELVSKDRMVCAAWSGNTKLKDMTLQRYLDAQHLQISSDGRSSGMMDRALKDIGLSRTTIAVTPYYMGIPYVLAGTDIMTVFGEGTLLALPPDSDLTIFPPPVELPDLRVELLYENSVSPDPGREWLMNVIREVVGQQDSRKKALYKKMLTVI